MTDNDLLMTHGGTAFPCANRSIESFGMSLRDYFAAKASDSDIDAMIFGMGYVDLVIENPNNGKKEVQRGLPLGARQIARYMHADAMIKERKYEPKTNS